MTKKQFIEKIDKFKPKYIYQRYNGNLIKYEVVDNNFLVDVKTGMSFDFRSHMMLGKVSKNIIDLIEVGDYVNGSKVVNKNDDLKELVLREDTGFLYINEGNNLSKIETIVTKEQFKNIEYIVED